MIRDMYDRLKWQFGNPVRLSAVRRQALLSSALSYSSTPYYIHEDENCGSDEDAIPIVGDGFECPQMSSEASSLGVWLPFGPARR
jgi:hypothetical protein